MPAIAEKKKVLNGRGIVGRWATGSSSGKFFYRELVPGTKRYRYRELPEAQTLDEAEAQATNAAIELASTEPKPSLKQSADPLGLLAREERLTKQQLKLARLEQKSKPSEEIEKAIKDYVRQQAHRRDTGQIADSTFTNKRIILTIHVLNYLKSEKVRTTRQITATTFDNYLTFRSSTTRIAQQRELSVLGEWIKSYLARNNLIDADLWMRGGLLPKVEVRMTDRMANPAINPTDWRTLIAYVREVWRREALDHERHSRRVWYYRNAFWHYLLLAKNTGMSPEEILKLKWKNIEIRDVGRISASKQRAELEALEAEAQADGIDLLSEDPTTGEPVELPKPGSWAPKGTEIGREERLIAFIYTIRAKTQQAREIPCNQGRELKRWMQFVKAYLKERGFEHEITGEDYVFANPHNEYKPIHQQNLGRYWRQIVNKLMSEGKLRGHKFSDKRYTLYSLRSTFIEDHLRKGTDLWLLARIAGHDVKELMKSYERLDIKERAQEITEIRYGQEKNEPALVNLLEL